MTSSHPSTGLDVDAILAKGWAERGDFPDAEFECAERFYASMRAHDGRLRRLRAEASGLVEAWTGRSPRDVGSFGTGLNLETSDLDLGIGYPTERQDELIAALADHTTFLGEHATRFATTRLVFSFTVGGVEVDLSALTEADFAVACRMLDQINQAMTQQERVCHTWVKHLLRTAGRLDDYTAWKLVTYRRFCREFHWVPIPEKTEA